MATRQVHKLSKKIGAAPGAMIHVGEKKVDTVSITVIEYGPEHLDIRQLTSIDQAFPFKSAPTVTWLNVVGLHEVAVLEKIGQQYRIHPLILEDALNTSKSPKIETFDDYIYILLKIIVPGQDKLMDIDQLSMILGTNFVLTFQERQADFFAPIRSRLANINGHLRKWGPDYLTCALMDVVVDNYFLVLEKMSDSIESLEDKVVSEPDHSLVKKIQMLRRDLILMRKFAWPVREVINSLIREEPALVQDRTLPYLRDIYDHVIEVVDTMEMYRDLVSNILEVYLSSLSTKLNEVMKVLTIIATFFIPLTFIVGIYGMNFEFMPELNWHYGYFMTWLVILVVSMVMFIYFKKKKWF